MLEWNPFVLTLLEGHIPNFTSLFVEVMISSSVQRLLHHPIEWPFPSFGIEPQNWIDGLSVEYDEFSWAYTIAP